MWIEMVSWFARILGVAEVLLFSYPCSRPNKTHRTGTNLYQFKSTPNLYDQLHANVGATNKRIIGEKKARKNTDDYPHLSESFPNLQPWMIPPKILLIILMNLDRSVVLFPFVWWLLYVLQIFRSRRPFIRFFRFDIILIIFWIRLWSRLLPRYISSKRNLYWWPDWNEIWQPPFSGGEEPSCLEL